MNKKGFANIILIILVVILAGTTGYFALRKPTTEPATSPVITDNDNEPITPVTSTPTNPNQTPPVQTINSGWKKYTDAQLAFEYPPIVSVERNGEAVNLDHSIAYKHSDVCDFKGDAPPLERLNDFGVSIKLINQNLKTFVQGSQYPGWDYVSANPFTLGSWSGYKIMQGIEGCGSYVYYLTISSNKTLVITRSLITELSSAVTDNQKYLALPGIISPNQEEEFFTKILLSLKVK
ncbi:MAG: hypothetical protein FJY98_00210 [Candidatus Liptonbacteria bacterium]|nr:hypothetical protein [Candidatus Liptonbacteria bacterium]